MAARRVVVVGAGFAGLEAGRRLARAGCEVTVLERAPAPGGRAVADGADAGFRVSTANARLAETLRDLGRDGPAPWPDGALAQAAPGGPVTIDPVDLAGVARVPGVGWRGALRVPRFARLLARFGPLLDPGAPERAGRLDDRSASDFGRLYFGARAERAWLAPRLRDVAQEDAREASRVLFFLEHGLGRGERNASLPAPATTIAAELARAPATHVGVEVLAIESGSDGRMRLRCQHRAGTGETPEVDAVVLATPPAEAMRIADPLLADAERDFLGIVRFAPALAVGIALRAGLARAWRRIVVPAGLGLPLTAIAVVPASDAASNARAVLFADPELAASHAGLPDDVVTKALLAAGERVLPGLAAAAGSAVVQRWREGLPRFPVGRYREIGRFHAVQRDRRACGRRLYFAGDWLVAGSLEGALASGARAAAAVLADLARA
jgi:predicted NAD/FAD-dependent oxidoreductase